MYEVSISIDSMRDDRNPLKVQVEVVEPSPKSVANDHVYSISMEDGNRSDDADLVTSIEADGVEFADSLDEQMPIHLTKRSHKLENDARIREFVKLTCHSCPDDAEPFETFKLLQTHYADVHQARGYAVCCDRKFFRKDRLITHITNHIDPNAFKLGDFLYCTMDCCSLRFSLFQMPNLRPNQQKQSVATNPYETAFAQRGPAVPLPAVFAEIRAEIAANQSRGHTFIG